VKGRKKLNRRVKNSNFATIITNFQVNTNLFHTNRLTIKLIHEPISDINRLRYQNHVNIYSKRYVNKKRVL
jgi:hypothetical protein